MESNLHFNHLKEIKIFVYFPEDLIQMQSLPRISIVTVNLNNGVYLEACIQSVLQQNYQNLEYIIVDGNSTDDSIAIIEKYRHHFHKVIIETDDGQYHAVQKGFKNSTGDIMAWINSDDKYLPNSFQTVVDIMNEFKSIKWLTGFAKEYTVKGSLIGRIHIPWCRWSKYRFYTNDFQFIQQESTFWKRELWETAGSTLDLNYELAADLELWARYFRHATLHTTIAELSGFRHRSVQQRSRAYRFEYLEESLKVIRREVKLLSFKERIKVKALYTIRWLFGPHFFLQIPLLEHVYPFFFKIPKLICYDFNHQEFSTSRNIVRHPSFMIGKKLITKKTLLK